MNKKRYIPLVVIGALILSLIAIFPAFGAGEVSFIDPNDIGPTNNGALKDQSPDVQEYGRQDGFVGLYIEDDDSNVPIRRVLLPTRDMAPVSAFDHDYDGTTADQTFTSIVPDAHSNEIEVPYVGHGVEVDDYLVIGDHTVRKVTGVAALDPMQSPAPVDINPPAVTWYVVRPDASAANPVATAIATQIVIGNVGTDPTSGKLLPTDRVTITATLSGDPFRSSTDDRAGDSLKFTIQGNRSSTLTPATAANLSATVGDGTLGRLTEVTPDGDGRIVIRLGANSFGEVGATVDPATDLADRTVTFNFTVTTRTGTPPPVTPPATDVNILTIDFMTSDQQKQKVTLDRAFDGASPDEDTVAEGIQNNIYKIGDWHKTAIDGFSWSDSYMLYAIAHEADDSFTDYLIADSGIGGTHNTTDGITAINANQSERAIRLKPGTLSGPRITNEDVLRVTGVGTGASDSIPTYAAAGRIAGGDNVADLASGNYLIAWFHEKNDIQVTIRSQAYPSNETLVMQETGDDTGKFSLRIKAAKFGTGTGEIAEPDKETNPPELPVNPRDVVTLAGAGSTGTLSIETVAPSFTSLLPAHNTAHKGDRPEISAHVTDGDSGVKKSDIRILFLIEEVGKVPSRVIVNPNTDGDIDDISNGFSVTGRMAGADAPKDDAKISWWIYARDEAGNVGYSDRVTSDAGGPDPCTAARNVTTKVEELRALITDLADTASCDPYVLLVDSTEPKLLRAETGRHWNSALQTGDSKDKTEYRVSKANRTSVLVVFDEPLDATSVTASDFEVDGAAPEDANVYQVKVRDDTFDENPEYDMSKDTNETGTDSDGNKKYINGDGNSAIAGDSVLDVGSERGYVFLRLAAELKSSAEPKVELVGDVLDLAGNEQDGGVDNAATDRIAPKLTVTIDEGTRPVTMDKVNLTITSDENIGTPNVMAYHVTKLKTDKDAAVQDNATSFAGDVKFVSGSEYTAVISSGSAPDDGGLYTIYVMANDAAGGNKGAAGDKTEDVDVSDDTMAILFEHDEAIGPPDVDPHTDGANDSFKTDDPNVYIRIDFASEANEYDDTVGDNPDTTAVESEFRLGDDLDTHHGVSIVSASLDGEDITSSIQTNSAGNIFLYKSPSPLTVGDHKLEVIAEDAAGNRHPLAQKATITIEERKAFPLKLNPGWNLVSLPGEPADPDINVVIPADRTDITSVLAYDPTVPGLWLSASRGADGMFSGTLKNITSSRGYWVETNTFTALPVNIPKQAVGQAITLPTIQLVKGWNMVPIVDVDGDFMLVGDTAKMPALGTPAMPNATPPTEATVGYFDGLEGVRAYTFNTITNRWELVSKVGGEVELGKGYWVYVTKSGIIVP